MARDATELVNFIDESTRKRKRTAAEQQEAVSVATASLEPCAGSECAENANEITAHNGTLGLGESDIQILRETKGSNLIDSLEKRISPKNGDSSADVVENDSISAHSRASSKSLDSKGARKVARTTGEKLWDGSLQLNSSLTLSTVAFFKSGEKMLDVEWSDIAEVIGKVRLDDLERYIRDLSRSRNRGLMVISLSWKEGSSISGLADMKKAAKCYREEQRVGFVKLSPGVDLYVCPCSDTMITILAKYGFFKGMFAIVDNKDSLIGCVVRRKNGAFTTSAPIKSDSIKCSLPERSLYPSFGSANQKSVEKDLSIEQPILKSIPIARVTESSALERQGNSGNEGKKHLMSSQVQLGSCNSSARANICPTSSILRPETSSASNFSIDISSVKGSMSQSSEVESAPIQKSSMERTKLSSVPQKPIASHPYDVTKNPTPTLDDLPDFDFVTSCAVFQPPRSVHAVTVDKKPLTERSRKMDGSMRSTNPSLWSQSTFSKQGSEIFDGTVFPHNERPRKHLLKKDSGHGEPQTASRGIRMPLTATAVNSKNFFDDSDKPEWRPQNVELCERSVPWVSCTSTTSVSLKVPNSATSIPLKVPNRVFGDFSFSRPGPSLAVPQIASPSITSGTLEVPNSTMSSPRPSLFVPQFNFPSITPVPLKAPNSRPGSFSFSNLRSSVSPPRINSPSITYLHSSNRAHHPANYFSTDATAKAAPPRPPGGYVPSAPSPSMVFSAANPLLRPPPNPFAFKSPVNPAVWRG